MDTICTRLMFNILLRISKEVHTCNEDDAHNTAMHSIYI